MSRGEPSEISEQVVHLLRKRDTLHLIDKYDMPLTPTRNLSVEAYPEIACLWAEHAFGVGRVSEALIVLGVTVPLLPKDSFNELHVRVRGLMSVILKQVHGKNPVRHHEGWNMLVDLAHDILVRSDQQLTLQPLYKQYVARYNSIRV